MTTEVPGVIDDLDRAWIEQALRTGAPGFGDDPNTDRDLDPGLDLDVDVSSVIVEPLGASVGLLGDLARLRLGYSRGSGPETVIVKLPASDPGSRQVGAMLRAWPREVAFYRDLAPRSSGVRVPRCYHLGEDLAAERWVVVLEDCPADPVDAQTGATNVQAEAAVDALAAFHARWWQAEQRFDWMPGFDVTGVGGLQGPWLDALPLFLDRYGHLLPGATGEWIQRFAPELTQWSTKAAGEPLTVVHADYRIDNLIFNGDQVTMIDWQTALRGPGAMDLSSFCLTSLTIEGRRQQEADLIGRYLDGLGQAGVTVDADWFADSYDETVLWWMGQFANNLARLKPDDEATQRALDTMIERTYTAALDRGVDRLLPKT